METSVKLVLEKITELCQTLGLQLSEFYPYVVKKVVIVAWASLIIPLIIVVISALVAKISYVKSDNLRDDNITSVICMASCVLLSCALITFLIGGLPSLVKILNPEYYAIKDILEMIK